MEQLVVKGKAIGIYPADAMRVTISFTNVGEHTREAIEWVQEQCEDFLETIQTIGIDLKSITLLDDNVSRCIKSNGVKFDEAQSDEVQSLQYNQTRGVYAQRRIELNLSADSKVYASILNVIRHNNYSCDFDVEYYISNIHQYQRELIGEAVENAKIQAEILANMNGMKLLKIEKMHTSAQGYVSCEDAIYGQEEQVHYESQMILSENLSFGKKELSEEVEVTWSVE